MSPATPTTASSLVSLHQPTRWLSPLIVASPHSGRLYPNSFLRQSRLDLATLRRGEDAHMDELLADAPAAGAPLLHALFPRVYCDVNRAALELDPGMFRDRLPLESITDSPKVRAGLGMIARIVAAGRGIYRERLTLDDVQCRIATCWQPYHHALQQCLAAARAQFGFAILLDGHSMPSPTYGTLPDIVLGDAHGRAASDEIVTQIENAFRSRGYRVARNNPYAGGYITQHYGDPRHGIHAVQIEIARSLYMDEATLTPNGNFMQVRNDMGQIIAEIAATLPRIDRPAIPSGTDAITPPLEQEPTTETARAEGGSS